MRDWGFPKLRIDTVVDLQSPNSVLWRCVPAGLTRKGNRNQVDLRAIKVYYKH